MNESLYYAIDRAIIDLIVLNKTTFEELREFDRCLDRHPDYLITSAEKLAESVREYREVTKPLVEQLVSLLAHFDPDNENANKG